MNSDVKFVITMARGDLVSRTFNLLLRSGGVQQPFPIEPDEIYFTVKNNSENKNYRFQKTLTNGGITKLSTGVYLLTIEPEDTDDLGFMAYDCDLEIVRNSDPRIKRTFSGRLSITEETTHHYNEGGGS